MEIFQTSPRDWLHLCCDERYYCIFSWVTFCLVELLRRTVSAGRVLDRLVKTVDCSPFQRLSQFCISHDNMTIKTLLKTVTTLLIWQSQTLIAVRVPMLNESRSGRLFNPLNIVRFPNSVCTSSSATNTEGTCYSASECASRGETHPGQLGWWTWNPLQEAPPQGAVPVGLVPVAPLRLGAGTPSTPTTPTSPARGPAPPALSGSARLPQTFASSGEVKERRWEWGNSCASSGWTLMSLCWAPRWQPWHWREQQIPRVGVSVRRRSSRPPLMGPLFLSSVAPTQDTTWYSMQM